MSNTRRKENDDWGKRVCRQRWGKRISGFGETRTKDKRKLRANDKRKIEAEPME